jgi:predicted MFS family arabinose efflux permease
MNSGLVLQPPWLERRATATAAVACGVAVASISLAQPLLATVGSDLALPERAAGVMVAVTQAGYGAGLLLVVPLGDRLARPRLIAALLGLLAAALLVAGAAPGAAVLLGALAAVGVVAVVTQVIVAHVATLAAPAQRGRAVGTVTAGVVVGILLARTFAGVVADAAGWRAVFVVAAAIVALTAVALGRALPPAPAPDDPLPYAALVRSTAALVVADPVLRGRAVLALLTFMAFNLLWSGMALPLAAAPHGLSDAAIGAFGLAGAAGALAAAPAGRLADGGRARSATTAALALLVLAWAPIALLDRSLLALAAGAILLDLAVQAVHVLSQARIYEGRGEDTASRATAAYMVAYSAGSAAGSLAASALYAARGWGAVCVAGAAVSALALAQHVCSATHQ